MRTGHAFLNDIAHHAAPGMYDLTAGDPMGPDTFRLISIPTLATMALLQAQSYDDEMLNAHFVTGDGRGNENIALTTVHSVFHSEHNRIVEANKRRSWHPAISPSSMNGCARIYRESSRCIDTQAGRTR